MLRQNGKKSILKDKRRMIFLILSVLCMLTIFMFSSRNGKESTRDSQNVDSAVTRIQKKKISKMNRKQKADYLEKIDIIVRKSAHFTEYMILAMLLFGAFYLEYRKKYINFLIPFLTASLYSVSDEVHQYFVSERTGTPRDVLIDSAGALAGVLIVFAAVLIVKKIRQRSELTKNHPYG